MTMAYPSVDKMKPNKSTNTGIEERQRRAEMVIGALFFISAASGAYLLATDGSLWHLAVSHAYGLAVMSVINAAMGIAILMGARRFYSLAPLWAIGQVILQVGDLVTAPAYNMTIGYFASYLFGLPAYDVLLVAQFAVLAVYFLAPRPRVRARKGAYFEAAASSERRSFIRIVGSIGAFFLLTVILSVIDLTSSQPSTGGSSTTSSTATSQSSSQSTTQSTTAGGNPSGVIAKVSDLQVGIPVTFSYPDSRHPNALFKLADGSIQAFSLLCTHVCCEISYNASSEVFFCPCHSSVFDSSGNVLHGPASLPLPKVLLQVDSSGNITPTGISGTSPCVS